VIKSKPWDFDYSAVAIPWHPIPEKKSLTIGVLFECPSWPVAPPILRAIKTAAKKLESAGHKVVKLEKFPSFTETTDLAWNFFDIDNEETGHKFIEDSGEPLVASVKDLYQPPPGGRKIRTLDNFIDMTAARSKFQAEWHKIFIDNQLDVILAPGSQKTAVPHDTFRLPPYTANWNLLAVRVTPGYVQGITTNAYI
jgi:amidase